MSRLPTPGSDNNDWGTVLNDYLQQSLTSAGLLVTSATNSYTGNANTNLASSSQPGLVQLAGDLGGASSTAASPALATSGVTAGSYTNASITVNAKGLITAASSGSSGVSKGFVIAMSVALG